MLQQLSIDNYILIPHLKLTFSKGFTCITGETGAGKSILVGALSLLTGQRADTSVLRETNKKCIIEGTFDVKEYGLKYLFDTNDLDYEEQTVFRREINQQGKSRAFINDTPVTLSVMKEIGAKLLDIHSQHQTLELIDSSFQTAIVDSFAQNQSTLATYSVLFKNYNQLKQELISKTLIEKQSAAEREYLQFQFNELEKAKLIETEQIDAENELDTLTHAEEIKTKTFAALQILVENETNVISSIYEVQQLLEQASRHNSYLKPIFNRIQETSIELRDIVAELRSQYDLVNYDNERIDFLSQRLDLIYQLEQKHKVTTVGELLLLQENLNKKLSSIDSLEEEIKNIQKQIELTETELLQISNVLSNKRFNVVESIQNEMQNLLASLGMPSAKFQINIEKLNSYTSIGSDKINFLFTANKGSEPKEIQNVASGGELSRLMLSIKSLVLNRNMLPTILFDEIDSGVSGDIAGKVGSIMRSMSNRMQVIAITHLPQIAGKANSHYLAYKNDETETTISHMKVLNDEERINEIARMLSDENVTESAKTTAKELLNFATNPNA